MSSKGFSDVLDCVTKIFATSVMTLIMIQTIQTMTKIQKLTQLPQIPQIPILTTQLTLIPTPNKILRTTNHLSSVSTATTCNSTSARLGSTQNAMESCAISVANLSKLDVGITDVRTSAIKTFATNVKLMRKTRSEIIKITRWMR